MPVLRPTERFTTVPGAHERLGGVGGVGDPGWTAVRTQGPVGEQPETAQIREPGTLLEAGEHRQVQPRGEAAHRQVVLDRVCDGVTVHRLVAGGAEGTGQRDPSSVGEQGLEPQGIETGGDDGVVVPL